MYSREAFLVHLCVREVEIEKIFTSLLAKKSADILRFSTILTKPVILLDKGF